jgi:phosphoribosylformimino-5-aminoimidazole carboxamide ribotide isomerase
MRIIPVLDLKGGAVVHARAGRRYEYRPVSSRLTDSSRPSEVAEAFRTRLGLAELYAADLDAIAGDPPALATLADLVDRGFALWVDAGLRQEDGAQALADVGVERIVAGLETVAGPAVLANLCRAFGTKVAFSLDLEGGRPLSGSPAWETADPLWIAEWAIAAGVRHLIVLDLARVGLGDGTGTEQLCRQLAAAHPNVEIVAGGGVRDVGDLHRLRSCGVRAALVASALHDGRLDREGLLSIV